MPLPHNIYHKVGASSRRSTAVLLHAGVCCLALLLAPLISTRSAAHAQEGVYDPIEPFNRGTFWFNDQADIFVVRPLAEGYDAVVPAPAKKSVSNFFSNLRYPSYLVSDLVQLKFGQALDHTGRFLLNSTVGLVGLFDVATEVGLPEHEEDFGIALAYYDIPPGPYLVLPILGPSNVRDALGRVVDIALSPFYWVGFSGVSSGTQNAVTYGSTALRVTYQRAELLEVLDTARQSSLDYYIFMQSSYYQHRRGVLFDGNPPEEDLNYTMGD